VYTVTPSSRLTARLWLATIVVLVWMAVPDRARAVAQNDKFNCTFDGSNVMAFGSYDSLSDAPLDQQGRVQFRCSNKDPSTDTQRATDPEDDDEVEQRGKGNPHQVQISISAGNAGNFNRYMSGADRLHYNIFLDAARQSVWGDGTGGTVVFSDKVPPNNHVVTVPVYGRVYGAQDVSAGQYVDTLIVTIDF
jgi:spore coat protein U-like protein